MNAVDYSGYPDCRPEFIAAFEQLATLATKAGVEGATCAIQAPLIHMSKAQIVREGARAGRGLFADRVLLPGGCQRARLRLV